jgi:hypothetical protein
MSTTSTTARSTTCPCGGRKHKHAVRCMACSRAQRFPCDDPHGTGCTTLVKMAGGSCVACNRQRGESCRFRSVRHAS